VYFSIGAFALSLLEVTASAVHKGLKPNSITLACSELVQSWLRTGSEHASDQIPLHYLVRSWSEPAIVMEFGFYRVFFAKVQFSHAKIMMLMTKSSTNCSSQICITTVYLI